MNFHDVAISLAFVLGKIGDVAAITIMIVLPFIIIAFIVWCIASNFIGGRTPEVIAVVLSFLISVVYWDILFSGTINPNPIPIIHHLKMNKIEYTAYYNNTYTLPK